MPKRIIVTNRRVGFLQLKQWVAVYTFVYQWETDIDVYGARVAFAETV